MISQFSPGHACPRPSGHRGSVNASAGQVERLFAGKQQQLGLAGMRRPGRLVLHQKIGRAAQISMLDMKGDLVGRQINLAAPFDHLQLHHHKLAMGECQQAVRDTQVDPGLNSGEMAVWDVLFQPFVQVRFRFQGHCLLPLRVLPQFA